jgi:tRNA modification GTPase
LIVVLNKVDLLADKAEGDWLPTSAVTGEGISELRRHLFSLLRGAAEICATPVTNLRQQQAIGSALQALGAASVALHESVPHEMLLMDLHRALRALDELTGATTTEDILALIFSTFCIGK